MNLVTFLVILAVCNLPALVLAYAAIAMSSRISRSELFAATREAIRRERQCQSLERAIRARIKFAELCRTVVHTRQQEVQP